MIDIKFGKLEDFNKNPDVYVGVIPSGITSKQQLLKSYADAFKFPEYFGFNWDALDECLSDFHWIKEKHHIVVYHQDIPSLGDKDTRILLKVLNDNAYEKAFSEDEKFKQSVIILFPEKYKEKVKEILEEIKGMNGFEINQKYK